MKAFICPMCGKFSLEIVYSLEMPSDARSDEITIQLIRCRVCGGTGIAIYEESRRGALGQETWDHIACWIDEVQWRTLERRLRKCLEPGSSACSCETHRSFAVYDASGRWRGLEGLLELSQSFPMRLVNEETGR